MILEFKKFWSQLNGFRTIRRISARRGSFLSRPRSPNTYTHNVIRLPTRYLNIYELFSMRLFTTNFGIVSANQEHICRYDVL